MANAQGRLSLGFQDLLGGCYGLQDVSSTARSRLTDQSLRVLREIGLLHAVTRAESKDGTRPKSAEEVLSLNLSDTKVTDAGLKELSGLKNLTALDLSSTQVSDASLKELSGLQSFVLLYVGATKITAAGAAELRKALPKCQISR